MRQRFPTLPKPEGNWIIKKHLRANRQLIGNDVVIRAEYGRLVAAIGPDDVNLVIT